jgi:hypothetical protein
MWEALVAQLMTATIEHPFRGCAAKEVAGEATGVVHHRPGAVCKIDGKLEAHPRIFGSGQRRINFNFSRTPRFYVSYHATSISTIDSFLSLHHSSPSARQDGLSNRVSCFLGQNYPVQTLQVFVSRLSTGNAPLVI